MHKYWARRNKELAEIQFKNADKVEAAIAKEYERATESIRKDIEVFYARYAKDNDITMAEARKLLSPKELKGFRMSLEEFRNKAMHNDNGQWTRDLDNEYIKSRVSRLEALKYQVRGEAENLFNTQHDKFDTSLSKAFKDAYYSHAENLKGFVKGGIDFATFDTDAVHNAIYTKWLDGNNFSSRIWNDKDKLLRELDTNLTQSVIRGDSPDKAIANIAKRMNVSKSRSAALYQTEYAHIINRAHMQSIKDAGFEEYEIDESMDELTCDECQELHGQHFKLSEYEEGVTAPPFHTRCRGTVTAYFSPEMLEDHSEELDNLLDEFESKDVDIISTEIISENVQNYKPVTLSDEKVDIERNKKRIVTRKITTSVNDIYVSENVNLKPKQLHSIDKHVTEIRKMLGIKETDNLPRSYIITSTEMNKNALATYNPVLNVMFFNAKIGLEDEMLMIQKQFAASGNTLSTYLHEFLHWQDAQKHIKKYGEILTEEQYKAYINKLNMKYKTKLDKLEKEGYNINSISEYAVHEYDNQNYNETYTEYRVKTVLEKRR